MSVREPLILVSPPEATLFIPDYVKFSFFKQSLEIAGTVCSVFPSVNHFALATDVYEWRFRRVATFHQAFCLIPNRRKSRTSSSIGRRKCSFWITIVTFHRINASHLFIYPFLPTVPSLTGQRSLLRCPSLSHYLNTKFYRFRIPKWGSEDSWSNLTRCTSTYDVTEKFKVR